MWIRSQDKKKLVFAEEIVVMDCLIYAGDILIGQYLTKERALKVLDEIETSITQGFSIYSMPKEEQ